MKFKTHKIQEAIKALEGKISSCDLCPRNCLSDRTQNLGYCKANNILKIYSYAPHHGEEPPISGVSGSGTIFFSNCNLQCAYCQNYEFSIGGQGRYISTYQLSNIMLHLQNIGCHNINLVTPTHYLIHILIALSRAIENGLSIPIVYNTSGYEKTETIKELEGIVDIYLVDAKYGNKMAAHTYSNAWDYFDINKLAIKEMFRQVGNLQMDASGIATKGVIVRHLVLPSSQAGTEKVLSFLKDEIGTDVFISLMSQYFPYYKGKEMPAISRRINSKEYFQARNLLAKMGFDNGWVQPFMDMDYESPIAGVNIQSR